MANRHFAKLAGVWKHLPLVEVLSIEQPDNYWETHAGHAAYAMVHDPERRFGVQHFVDVAKAVPGLARSRYLAQLRAMNAAEPVTVCPGSPMLAMRELGNSCSYLLCDTDPASVADLEAAASSLGLSDRTRVVDSDGMTALHEALPGTEGTILAHVDPYDPWAAGPSGLSALDLARELISQRVSVMYWYGYSNPERRGWAFDALAQSDSSLSIWCGDVMIGSYEVDMTEGDLGVATTPGTGFGIVGANLSAEAINACRRLGESLASAYDGAQLPDGRRGFLDFRARNTDHVT